MITKQISKCAALYVRARIFLCTRLLLLALMAILACTVQRGYGQQKPTSMQGPASSASVQDRNLGRDGGTSVRFSQNPRSGNDATDVEEGAWGYRDDSAPALPAYRIIEILRLQQDMLYVAKKIALQRQRSEKAGTRPGSDEDLTGNEIAAKSAQFTGELADNMAAEVQRDAVEARISDDDLFELIDDSRDFRVTLTRVLKSKGLLVAADYEKLAVTYDGGDESNGRDARAGSRGEPRELDRNRPNVSVAWSPYKDIPAFQYLYTQFPAEDKPLHRFGEEVFRRGTGNFDSLPMDLPAGPDYVLGPGDSLNINVWGTVSRQIGAVVDRAGTIALPEAGSVMVAGKTLAAAQQTVERALGKQFREARVDMSLVRLRTVRVYVVGDVRRPGAYDVSSLSTPLNALYIAGGPTSHGSMRLLRHLRGRNLISEIDLYDFLLRGMRADGERLEPGDTILVPPVGPQVTVAGLVRRPAIYELKAETELGEVLDAAGGLLVSASSRQINVERIEAHRRRTLLSVSVPDQLQSDTVGKTVGSFKIQDGDRITVSSILPYSEETIYVQGHVYRPGKLPFHAGMTVSDVLRSSRDTLPEPSEHAEIVRLAPPDYRPTVIEFKLSEVLSGQHPIELRPFDTVRVFGRYEIDAPKVAIYGEVLRPGEYPLSQNMSVSELVALAGGFKRSAMTRTADVASYVVDNGEKVLTKHSTVELSKAIDSDENANIKLKPGDVVTIHQLTGWSDIGSSVTVKGEVGYPGTYGIHSGERLSAVLKRAGGFRDVAYPQGAVLQRVQVREIEQANRQQLISRIESSAANFKAGASTGQEQVALLQAMQQQQQQVLSALRSQPVSGRIVIDLSRDIANWENTPADIEMREGDVLVVPKMPNFVVISGQVYNASAIAYTPGKKADWYLKQAGGATELANKKGTFVIRANGSVVGNTGGDVLGVRLQPGDSIVVPDKIIGGSAVWKNMMTTAQIVSSIALTAAVVASF